MTDFRDSLWWWKVWDVGDRFFNKKVTNLRVPSSAEFSILGAYWWILGWTEAQKRAVNPYWISLLVNYFGYLSFESVSFTWDVRIDHIIMSDDVPANCLGGENGHFSHHFRKSQKIWEEFNGSESFVSQFFIEWNGVLHPTNPI